MKDVHTRGDAQLGIHAPSDQEWRPAPQHVFLFGILLSSMPKHPLFSLCLLFLAEALALSKVTSLTSASLLHRIANTHLPCRKQAWISNGFFRLLLRQMRHQFLHEFLNTRFLSNIQSIRKELIMWEKGLMLKEPKENSITAFCSYVIEAI